MPAPDSPLILTLDVGTSSVRAITWDRTGTRVDGWEAEIEHQMTVTPDGGVETDVESLFKRTAKCIDRTLEKAGTGAGSIAAVGISCFWHSLAGIDGNGKAITPLLTWADTRSRSAAEELKRRLNEQAVHQRTGCPLHSSYLPAKLLWLSQTQPDAFQQVRAWMSFGEYCYLRLFNTRVASLSMASGTGMFDQNRCTWDGELLSALPVTAGQFSELVDADFGLSGLRKKWAQRWPALKDVAWYPPLGDGACSNVGSNCSTPNRIALTVGTSAAMRVVSQANDVPLPLGLWRYRLDRKHIVLGGALSSGGNLVRWLRATINTDKQKTLLRRVAALPPDGHGLTVLPFLAGERSPGYRSDARGAIAGLSLSTTPPEIVRAGLESVSYQLGRIHDLLSPLFPDAEEIAVSGGAILNRPQWMQITADVLGRRLVICAEPEATSRGAALMALQSLGELASIEAAPDCSGESFDPDDDYFAVYRSARERQQHLYDLLLGPDGRDIRTAG